jgi:agmatine deiminase
LTIHKLHQPDPMTITAQEAAGVVPLHGSQPRPAGGRMAASYVNFYIANGGIVVPQFGDRHDAEAIDTLRRVFPDRQVVGVAGREILLGGGNIHCITQQQPSGAL